MSTPISFYDFNSFGELSIAAGNWPVIDTLRSQMLSVNPDVVFIQEIHSQVDINNFIIGTPYTGTAFVDDMATLTRHTMVSKNSSLTNDNGYAFLGAKIRVDGTDIYTANMHLNYLNYFSVPLEEARRDGQMAYHLSQINAFAGNMPTIIAGDMNAASHLDWPNWPNAAAGSTGDGGSNFMVGRRLLASPYPGFTDPFKRNILQVETSTLDPWSTWVPADYTLGFSGASTGPFRHERIDNIYSRGFTGSTGATTFSLITGGGNDHRGVYVVLTTVPGYTAPTVPGPELKLESTSFVYANPVRAVFANGPGNPKDWVGVYASADTPGTQSAKLWKYVNNSATSGVGYKGGYVSLDNTSAGTEGGANWPAPTGTYKAYFFQNDTYTVLTGPVNFTVAKVPTISFGLNKTSYSVGEQIVSSFSGAPMSGTNWVGIYLQSQGAPGTSGSAKVWLYVGNLNVYETNRKTNGNVYFRDSNCDGAVTWPLAAGSYKAYFLLNSGYSVGAGPINFTVA